MSQGTRIKYKLNEGVYYSTKAYLDTEGRMLTAVIHPGKLSVSVTAFRSKMDMPDVVVEEVPYKNFTEAKLTAKALLRKYGVNFLAEVRKKKDDVVLPGSTS